MQNTIQITTDLMALRSSHPDVAAFLKGKFVLSGTGHRPEKLGGYEREALESLIEVAKNYLGRLKPEVVITGMALGWDTALAAAAYQLRIPYVAAIPFPKQASRWPRESQERHAALLKRAAMVVCVGSDVLADADIKAVMQWRNEFMVDHCHILLACFDGSGGGTANCVKDAAEQKKTIVNTYRKWMEDHGPAQAEPQVTTKRVQHDEYGLGTLRGETQMKVGPCYIVDFPEFTAIVPISSVRSPEAHKPQDDVVTRVLHTKFGEGTLLSRNTTVNGEVAEVLFADATRKMVMTSLQLLA